MSFCTRRDFWFLCADVILTCVRLVPGLRLKFAVADLLGQVASLYSPKRPRKTIARLSSLFPTWTPMQVRQVARASLGIYWRNFLTSHLGPAEMQAARTLTTSGLSELDLALEKGRGAILWEIGAFGYRYLARQALHLRGYRQGQLHSIHHMGGSRSWVSERWVLPRFYRRESAYLERVVVTDPAQALRASRNLERLLGENMVVCIAGDGRGGSHGEPQTFLGRQEVFSTGPFSLASASGAPLFPSRCVEMSPGCFDLLIGEPILVDPAMDREARTALMRTVLTGAEREIFRWPGQYYYWFVDAAT